MNEKGIVKNIAVSMVMKPISMILSFVYVPLVISFLGEEKYGVWVIILNVVSWINYFDIGIGNGLRNTLTEAISKKDYVGAQKYVSTAYVGTTILSFFFCLILSSTWKCLNFTKRFNLEVLDEDVTRIIIISIIFVSLNFILGLNKSCIYAMQKPGIISVVEVVAQLMQIGLIYFLSLRLAHSLIAVAIAYGTVSFINNFMLGVIIKKNNGFLRFRVSSVDMTHMRPMLTLGVGFFFMQICSLVLNTTDNLLISTLFGSVEVTPYSLVYTAFYVIVQIHAIIIMPMWSAYTAANVNNDMKWIRRTIRNINLITTLMSFVVVIGIFVFEPLSKIWLGRELEYGTNLIVIVAIYMIVQMFANNYSSFLCGVGYIKVSVIISVIGAITNIPISVFFAKKMEMGVEGIVLGSLFVMLVSIIVLPFVSYKWIKGREEND